MVLQFHIAKQCKLVASHRVKLYDKYMCIELFLTSKYSFDGLLINIYAVACRVFKVKGSCI